METILLTDGYKVNHHLMYPKGIEMIYSNLTPRSNKFFKEAKDGVVVFGLQYLIIKYLIEDFNTNFFNRPKAEVISEYVNRLKYFTGNEDYDHIAKLWDLGYLPIEIKALPEGSICPIKVPMMTIKNTHKEFAWLTNYLETLISNVLWMPCTNATGARISKKQLKEHAIKTGFPEDINIDFLIHDFSMRGMNSVESSIVSGMAHLTSFVGTETIPAIWAVEKYYKADSKNELVAGTVAASEHSIECSNSVFNEDGTINERPYFDRLLSQFPTGYLSIVSDGFDFWKIIEEYLPEYKDRIMARDGRLIIRPDSGDPVDIICGLRSNENYTCYQEGDKYYCVKDSIVKEISEGQYYGAYYMLGKIFGWNFTNIGYKYPDTHIGLIYGDAINYERQSEIYRRLEDWNMAACNSVLARGSFVNQHITRDSLGFAIKCTAVKINGELKPIFKHPKTDDGTKNSLKGLIRVEFENGQYVAYDNQTEEQEKQGCLKTIFKDGLLVKKYTLSEIRKRINNSLS